MTSNIDSLLIRKAEIEDWFKWHPNSPDERMMRDEYRKVNEAIGQYANEIIDKTIRLLKTPKDVRNSNKN